jgi:hypothetical protein
MLKLLLSYALWALHSPRRTVKAPFYQTPAFTQKQVKTIWLHAMSCMGQSKVRAQNAVPRRIIMRRMSTSDAALPVS